MTLSLSFNKNNLKKAIAVAKASKPANGDYIIRFNYDKICICSIGKRHVITSNAKSISSIDVDKNWISEEFHIPVQKLVLFDQSDYDHMNFTFDGNIINIESVSGSSRKKASIRRRSDIKRRNMIPNFRTDFLYRVNSEKFCNILHCVGCSALVHGTKTEEEMRLNQVHFYSLNDKAYSSTRFQASVSDACGFGIDISVISVDIPIIKTFCSKFDIVGIRDDKNKLCIIDADDESTDSIIVINKVVANKPEYKNIDTGGFSTELKFDKETMMSSLDWAISAIDGTQRVTCDISSDSIKMSSGVEILDTPINLIKGNAVKVDLPVRYLRSMVNHINSREVIMKLGHKDVPAIIEISENDDNLNVRHYVLSMKSR